MKKLTALVMLSVCLLGLCSCSGSMGPGRPVAPVIDEGVTDVAVTHTLMGQNKSWTIPGGEIALLRQWASELKYKYVEFEPGNTPGDSDGGEVYTFKLTPDENNGGWPGFSYVKNGPDDCWLLIEGRWFSVSNPSYPPVSEPKTPPGGRVEDIYYTAPKLTVEILEWLVELRGEDLSWSDFILYECEECEDNGCGLYILRYPIDDTLCLIIGGVPHSLPMYIRLAVLDGDGKATGRFIDVRTESIDDFLSENGA